MTDGGDAVVERMEATVPCEANHSNVDDGVIQNDDPCCCTIHHMAHSLLLHCWTTTVDEDDDEDDKVDVVEDDVPSVPLLDSMTRR